MISRTTISRYVDGQLVPETAITGLNRVGAEQSGWVWVDLEEPAPSTVADVAAEFDLDEQLSANVLRARLRTGVADGARSMMVALTTVRPTQDDVPVQFDTIRMVFGRRVIVTVRYGGDLTLDALRRRVIRDAEMLQRGPIAILYAVLDDVVTTYEPMVERLEADVAAVEQAVFDANADSARRIYYGVSAVLQFQRAIRPVVEALARLTASDSIRPADVLGMDAEAYAYLRSIQEQVLHVGEELADLRRMLEGLQQVNLTLVSGRQTDRRQEVAQKISAWAAIMVVPTLITGVYGMNFQHMPELTWPWGYPFVLGLTVLICALLYRRFKRSGWL